MQIVNPLRAALPYITLQTAKVQHCWADYFIFRGFAGAAGRFGSAETSGLRPLKPPGGRFGLRPHHPACPAKPKGGTHVPYHHYQSTGLRSPG